VIRSGRMGLLFRDKERIGLLVLQFRYIYGLKSSIRCIGIGSRIVGCDDLQ
jgi:hypothetical protein